jgi:transglutaminase-like putative cysteine protease
MTYRTTHTTTYLYDESVAQSLSEARLTPRTFERQKVLEVHIAVQPDFATVETRTDYFGNDVTTIAVFGMHERFVVTSTSVVEAGIGPVRELPDVSWPTTAWETVRDRLAATPDEESIMASEFTFESPYVPMVKPVAEYARTSFTPGRPLIECLRDVKHRIHNEFVYKPESTSIEVPLQEVMDKRHGVCQDFAHVMIGAVRSVGLAARYVSGYLRSGADVQGAEASHAWVSAWVPGAGWVDFDPTNDVMPTDGHVTVGWGRDFGDVTPVKGVALGGGGQTVEVEVRVVPLEKVPPEKASA